MSLDNIKKAILEDIKALFQLIMEDDRFGTNKKVNINTLKDSNVHDDVDVILNGNLFSLYYNDYLDYIQYGRKPKARKVPIKALYDWAVRKGIPTDNNTLYAIRESIYKQGIPSRPILSVFTQQLDREWDNTWSDKLFNEITKELEKYFE